MHAQLQHRYCTCNNLDLLVRSDTVPTGVRVLKPWLVIQRGKHFLFEVTVDQRLQSI